MKLRVAMVSACPYPVPQGSQVFLRETALTLLNLGHEVHLVVYGYGVGEEEDPRFIIPGHDPAVLTRFPKVVDAVVRIE